MSNEKTNLPTNVVANVSDLSQNRIGSEVINRKSGACPVI